MTSPRRTIFVARRAFTLIELAAVSLIVALLAGAVVWSFSGPIAAARAADALDRVRTFDAVARQATANNHREAVLRFDLYSGSLERYDAGQPAGPVYQARLPQGYRIARFRAADVDLQDGDDRRVSIRCSAEGRTSTYAVQVVGPSLDRWMVFAGLSGQATEFDRESEVDAVFAALGAERRVP